MANSLVTQTIIDGPRNLVVKATAILDTSDLALTTIVTPSSTFLAPPFVQLQHIDYAIQDGMEVQIQWQGTPNTPILVLAGRGRMSFHDFGGIPDNATTPTGNIQVLTTGVGGTPPASPLVFTLVLEMTKIGTGSIAGGVR